ncbi:phage tail tip protein J-related protein [Providencia hangzhouensis]|uniref:phage tail tip protein J-related protein n=1 Tax=Providencia hangzhouensis TaxID=3031799 RepID=UPI0034DDA18A
MGKVVSNIVSTGLMIAGAMMGGPAGWAMIAAGMATQFAGSRLFKDKMPSMGYRDQSERKQMLRSPTAPETIIVGKTVCSGLLFFAEEEKGDQTENERLFMALAIAAHKVDHIGQIWLNDDLIGTFGDKASYEFHNGRTDCDPYLLKNAPSWKSDMIGDGLAWLRLTLKYDAEKFPYGVPNIKVEVWGKPVYDPRTNKTAWSNNGALIILDFYRSYLGVPDSDIDFDAFKVAADLCSEPVTTPEGNTEPRYTINGAYELSESPSEILDHMHKCIAAEPTYVAGKHGILMQAYNGPAVLRIEPNQIIDTVNITPELSLRDATNAIYGTFVDAEQQYIKTDFEPVIVDEWIEEDGLEIKENMDYRFVTSPYQAARLSNLYLRKKRAGRRVQLRMNMDGYAYRPGEVILLNLPQIGIQNLEFRVAEWKFHPQEGVDILLEEDGAYIYEDIIGKPFVRPPFTVLPTGGVAPPLNLTFVATNIGEVVQGYLSWQSAAADVRYNTVNIIENGKVIQSIQVPQDRVDLSGLVRGSYRAEVRSINAAGAMSAPAIVDFDIQAPPKPVSVEMVGGMFSLTCIPHGGETAQHGYTFEFWFSDKKLDSTNDTEVTAKANRQGQGQFWTKENLKADTDYWFYVRTVNSYGKSPFVEAVGKADGTPKDMIDELGNNFLSNEAGKRMESQIEDIALEQLEIKHELVDIDSKTIELDNKVLSLNTDLAIVNETTLQNQIYATNLRYEFKRETVRTEGKIFRLEEVNAQQDAAAARFQEQISARVDYNASAILRVEHAQVTLEEATAEKINQVTAEVDAAKGRITTVEKATATLEKAQAEFKQTTIAEFDDIYGAITRMEIANTNKEIAQAETAMQTIASFSKMTDRLRTSEASILRNEKAIATADKAIAEAGVQLKAHIDDTAANITDIKKVQVEQDKALAQTREQLTADIKAGDDKLKGAIDKQGRELSDISSVVDSQKTAIANLEETTTETKENQQSIYEEMHANFAQVRKTQADQALSQAESTSQTTAEVSKVRNDNRKIKAQVERTEEATATLEKAQAKLSEKVSALNEETEAAFVRVTESIAEVDKAQTQHTEQARAELQKNIDEKGQQIDEQGKVIDKQGKDLSDVSSAVTKNANAIADTNKTIAENEEKTSSRFEGNEADIAHMQKAEADKESSQAETLLQLAVQNMKQGNDARVIKASIIETNKLIATNEVAHAEKFTQLNAQYEQSNARFTRIEKAISDNEKAQASTNETIQSEIKDTKAAIERRAETSVDHRGNASSVFSIKSAVMLNGQYYEAQMMIGAIVKNGKVTTQIGFSADTFGIFNPSSGKLEPAFMVVNGQVVINEAFINKAVIGSIVVQTDMRSPDYVPGKSGMRIDMQNGVFETNSNDGDYSVIRNSKGNYFKYKGVYIMEQGWFL